MLDCLLVLLSVASTSLAGLTTTTDSTTPAPSTTGAPKPTHSLRVLRRDLVVVLLLGRHHRLRSEPWSNTGRDALSPGVLRSRYILGQHYEYNAVNSRLRK
ncbi:unnamed protein product [Clonostachys chloroleuca]|uniref:Secreted protein n=1 Tax=Clonostachys chloroleuca TaxID=1926264 RepID=A0AA35LTP4_9HYPO|nr:unnamed protein product [Clonostachys chloroleuca]